MCDYSPFREQAMTVSEDKTWWCDPCITPIVKALNDAGLRTVASCCGHGMRNGSIILANHTELVIQTFVTTESDEPCRCGHVNSWHNERGACPECSHRGESCRPAAAGRNETR